MRTLVTLLVLFSPFSALAEGETPGEFDYYVLSLSWSPNWCAREGDARNSVQCDSRNDYGWILHGLWPQNNSGWPSFCPSRYRNPSRRETRAMSDIMGTSGLAWHQWQKHGRCSGLTSEDYFALSRDAFETITRPDIFRRLKSAIRLPAGVVEEAFLQANPNLSARQVTVTCKDQYIHEARFCMSRDLEFMECGVDISTDCAMPQALMEIIR